MALARKFPFRLQHCLSPSQKSFTFLKCLPNFYGNTTLEWNGEATINFSQCRSSSRRLPLLSQSIFRNSYDHFQRVAITDDQGDHTYEDIFQRSLSLAEQLSSVLGPAPRSTEGQKHVCLLVPPSAQYVVAQWAVWMAGHAVVPLCVSHPSQQLKYFIRDSESSVVLCSESLQNNLPKLSDVKTIVLPEPLAEKSRIVKVSDLHPSFGMLPCDSRAMIIYTSGTTGNPKGVVLSHGNLESQILGLTKAWQYAPTDVLLNCLPLHHIHGIVNALMVPLSTGARAVLTYFQPEHVWRLLLGNNNSGPIALNEKVNVFMGVPTMYAKLLQHYDEKMALSYQKRSFVKATCQQNIRLMVSGSASLPESVMVRWRMVTGHTLLERYGMTEIGMALTNPLMGERKQGFVGRPFPGVSVRIAQNLSSSPYSVLCEGDEFSTTVSEGCENQEGELLVKGPTVFKEYWKKNKASKKEFTDDGWFKTGDTAVFREGSFKILGRTSVDIIKTGGFKVSALQVERALLEHKSVRDVAVVGLNDITWGQKISAVLVWDGEEEFSASALRDWLSEHLPHYQIPSVYKIIPELPRNPMGKVNKKQLVLDLFPENT